MVPVAFVEAVTARGLVGDRYAQSTVTLIELENIEAFVASTGLVLAPDQPRRNIVTGGIDLNSLCGKRFNVGSAVFEGLELCEPCGRFAKRTHREILKFFVGKGGLRAQVVAGGEIHVGDRIGVQA
jgi:MOSC domain-containing protein YiiM